MDLQKTKKRNKPKGKKGRKLSPQERFQREWQRVTKAKKQNEKLRDEVQRFAQQIAEQIGEEERANANALYACTERLIAFLSRKSLAQWQRQELMGWVLRNLENLAFHPFSDHLDLAVLNNKLEPFMPEPDNTFSSWGAGINERDRAGEEAEEDSATASKEQNDSKPEDANFDIFEDLFGAFEPEQFESDSEAKEHESTQRKRNFFEELFEEEAAHYDRQQQQHKQKVQALDQVLKASSLNKMFRKIAARLHPDREPDTSLKQLKHEQMSRLIEARDRHDVLSLFTLYKEHVGEPFEQLVDTDHESLIEVLKHQVEELKAEREDIIQQQPREGMLYRQFHAPSKAKVQNKVRKHLNQLRESTQSQTEFVASVTSLNKLKPYLEAHYDMASPLDELMESLGSELGADFGFDEPW